MLNFERRLMKFRYTIIWIHFNSFYERNINVCARARARVGVCVLH